VGAKKRVGIALLKFVVGVGLNTVKREVLL